jgi:hypothetical protein
MSERYEFFPDDVKSKLPPLYSQEKEKDPVVHVKFFCPWNQWTWFITEGEQRDGDFLMFGYVIGQEREWGYVSLNELSSVIGPWGLKIERDIYFTSKPQSQIREITS